MINKKCIFLFCLLFLLPTLLCGQESSSSPTDRLRLAATDRKDGAELGSGSATRPEWVRRSGPSERLSKVPPKIDGNKKKWGDGDPTTVSKAPPKWVQRSGSSTQQPNFLLFRPLDPLKPPADLSTGKFRELREDQWKQALGDLPTDAHGDLIQHYVDYELNPNITTALRALKHFNTLSHNKELRGRAHEFNLNLFQTLDVLKFELPLQAVIRENNHRRNAGQPLIDFSYRVGSSGKRFRQWVDWAAKGKDLAGMPIDEIYKLKKLSKSDDDNTNEVADNEQRKDPLLNEQVNGKRMEDVVAQVTNEWTGGKVFINASEDLQMEFLSPTKAYPVIYVKHYKISVSEGLDGKWNQAWNEKWPNFMAAEIARNKEKYRGAYAEEQLHTWGLKAGYVLDLRKLGAKPNITQLIEATTEYAKSGIADIKGRTPFSKGTVDPSGWMANQYRMAFVVHKGSVQDVAKYTQRMVLWWDTFNIKTGQDLRNLGIDINDADFNFLNDLARKIRSPKNEAELVSAIGNKTLQDEALKKLKYFNRLLLCGGHRRHIADLTDNMITVLRQYGEPGKGPTKDRRASPTIDDLMAANDKDNPFYKTMETLATAYSNLPQELINELNKDHARQIKEKEKSNIPEAIYGVEVHKVLLAAMKRAQKAGARLDHHGQALAEIHGLVGKLRDDINEHLKQIADGADLSGYIDQVIAGEMKRKRVRVIWDGEESLPKVTWATEQWKPADVRDDLKVLHTIANLCGWSNKTYAEHLYEYFEGPTNTKDKKNILDRLRKQSWASLAVESLNSLKNLYDPKNMKERFVELKTSDGKTMRLHLKPTGGRLEAGLNLGVTSFKLTIKGAQGTAYLWKVSGDVTDFKVLALDIYKTVVPAGAETMETRAQRYAMMLSKTISLFEYAENVATWAKNPFLVDKLGSSLATAAELSADPYDDDAVQKLASAMLKDIALWVQPELALAFAFYEIYEYSATALSLHYAKENFVNLLVENGDWEWKDKKGNDLPRPRLKGVFITKGGSPIPTDGKALKEACMRRAASADATGRFRSGPVVNDGLIRLAKLPEPAWKNGIKLLKSGGTVHPRKDLLTIYYKEGYETRDEILKYIKKSVARIPKGGMWMSSKEWTKEWLEREANVYVSTPEDATAIVKEKIRVKMKEVTSSDDSWGEPLIAPPMTDLTVPHMLAGVKEGVRKNFGFLVSEYWTRRQNIMECSMLDPLVEMATRLKEAEELEKIDFDKFLAEMRRLDKRMQELDRKVWAEIARSADPFKGSEYAPNDKKERYIPITKDYRKRTAQLRTFLEEAKTSVDRMNERKARGEDFWFQTPGKIQVLYSYLPNEFKSEGGLISQSSIVSTARTMLQKMLKVVEAYEDTYGEMLNILAGTEKWVGQNSSINEAFAEYTVASLPLKPFHVRIRPGEAGADNITAPTYESTIGGIESVLSPLPGLETKPVVEKWDKAYRNEFDTVRDDLGAIIKKMLKRLRPLVDAGDLLPIACRTLWLKWAGFMQAEHQELATYHPYWNRMLRLRFQIRKIENMLPGADEATQEEVEAAIRLMVLEKKQGLEIFEGWDGTNISGHLQQAKSAMMSRYKQLLQLAERMFDMELKLTPEDELKVSDKMVVTLKVKPLKDLKGPDEQEIQQLVHRYLFELAPQDREAEPSDPACLRRFDGRFWLTDFVPAPKPKAVKKSASQKGGQTSPDKQDSASGQLKAADTGSNQAASTNKKVEWKKRLRKSGKYKLRVIALTRDDVPLSTSEPVDVVIKPARMQGKLEIVGEWNGKEDQVAVFMGLVGVDEEKPRFRLTRAGDFDMPLCSFSEGEIPPDVVEPKDENTKPAKFPPKPFEAYTGVEKPEKLSVDEVGFKEPGMVLKPKSKRVSLRFEERAKFKLEKPLRLEFSQGVTITVKVFDASGQYAIENAAVTIYGGGASHSGYTARMMLKPKDVVYATVGYSGHGFSLTRPSKQVTYDPEAHAEGITIRVNMPFFPKGALTVKGRFIPEGGITEKTLIGGGNIWSNIADKQTVAKGGEFEFKNDQPVLVSEGLEIKAVLFRHEDKRLMAPIDGKIIKKKTVPRAVNDLGDIKVKPFDLDFGAVQVAVRDWTGKTMPDKGASVKMSEQKAARVGEEYECPIIFKYKKDMEIRAAFAMPTGDPVTEEISVSLDQFGDLTEPKPPEDPFEIDLGVYLPGSLKIKGRTEVAAQQSMCPPEKVEMWLALGHPDLFEEWSETVGVDFFDELTEPVRKDALLDLEATAASEDATYSAKVSKRTPKNRSKEKIAIVDFGTIRLKGQVKLVEVPSVIGMKIKEATALLTGLGFRVAPQDGDPAPKRAQKDEVYQQEPVQKKSQPLKLGRGAEIKLWAYGAAKQEPLKPYRPKAHIESVRVDKPVAWRGGTVKIITRVFVEEMKKGNPVQIMITIVDLPPSSKDKLPHKNYFEGLSLKNWKIDGDYTNQVVELVNEWTIKRDMLASGDFYPVVTLSRSLTNEQLQGWDDIDFFEQQDIHKKNEMEWKAGNKITVKGKTNRLLECCIRGPVTFAASPSGYPFRARIHYAAFGGFITYKRHITLRITLDGRDLDTNERWQQVSHDIKVMTNAGIMEISGNYSWEGSQSIQCPSKGVMSFKDIKAYLCSFNSTGGGGGIAGAFVKLNGAAANISDAVMTVSGQLDPGGPMPWNKPPKASGTFRVDAKYIMEDWNYKQKQHPKPIWFSGTWWAGRTAKGSGEHKADSKIRIYPGEIHRMITGEAFEDYSKKRGMK
ncbi:MAG: hypothetical protein U9R66_06185 [Thermodesulfobacteriota bacterium]|nr:hypothetical protein [Thermodesulfobacteriota bacterium]